MLERRTTQPSRNTVAADPPRLYLLPPLAPPRRRLSPRIGYTVTALVVGLGGFASVTPSPLYRSYSVLWHFSPLTLTLIYATYAFGVLASLLLAGGVSDDVGRRPVLLAALGALMASSVLFMVANSAAWLFVARGLQGLATGAALSAASAALLDLHPNRDPAGVGLTTATAAAGGIGLGVLVSSVHRHVPRVQVRDDTVDGLRNRGAGRTARLVARAEHEVVDAQLGAAVEQLRQRARPAVGVEAVLLLRAQGSSRRCCASSSPSRVCSFSRASNSWRAAAHSSGPTTL